MNKDFSMGEAINFGFQKTIKYFWTFFLIVLTIMILEWPLQYRLREEHNVAIIIILYLLTIVIGTIINLGTINIAVKLSKNEDITYGDLFTKARLFWKYLFASIIYSIIVLLGLILFIIPGIIWSIKYQFFGYFIVEEDINPIESLRASAKITEGLKFYLFIFMIFIIILNVVGVILLGVGLFITIPITIGAYGFLYRTLKKQSAKFES